MAKTAMKPAYETRRSVTVAVAGDFGKPRPALVIQSDHFASTGTVTVLLITSTRAEAPLIRVDIAPSQENGLRKHSQIAIDKAMSIKREKGGRAVRTPG